MEKNIYYRIDKMKDLIYCGLCRGVFTTKGLTTQFEHDLSNLSEDNKNIAYWNWSDLEQTQTQYLIFCQPCSKWTHHYDI